MINIIEGASNSTIAVEIFDGYEVSDEKALEKMFEDKLASGISRINLLLKIDKLNLNHSSWKALWNDGIYGLKHIKNCGHIAIVGNSKFEEVLTKMDNVLFVNEKADRMEKYFDIADLDKALGWTNE